MAIQIVKYGTKVSVSNGSIKAFITGICIRDEGCITYEISYFQGGQNVVCWIKRFEFEIDIIEKQKAGFVNYDIPNNEDGHIQILLPT
jgi:hypothetical protein